MIFIIVNFQLYIQSLVDRKKHRLELNGHHLHWQ